MVHELHNVHNSNIVVPSTINNAPLHLFLKGKNKIASHLDFFD